MLVPPRRLLPSPTHAWLVGVVWLGVTACGGTQTQSAYQQQQQAQFYAELLQQQAQAQQAADAQAASQAQAAATAPVQQQAMMPLAVTSTPLVPAPAVSLPVARVDGQSIAASDLAAHQIATGLARADALDDLVDLILLRGAAIQQRLPVSSEPLLNDARAELERVLADRLDLGLSTRARATAVHAAVRARLREGKIVEILEIPALQQ